MNKNELASAVLEYSHTMTSKAVTVIGGASAVSQTSFGGWVANAVDWFHSWPWMTTLSYVAIILLIIERGFIVWAWNRKRRRGEI